VDDAARRAVIQPAAMSSERAKVLQQCVTVLPDWAGLTVDRVEFANPKGFSSFTMMVRPLAEVSPPAVLYRRLEGKDNAILDARAERDVFLLLGEHTIAAHCLHYGEDFRLEEFFDGRTLTRHDVFDADFQAGVVAQLHRFHQLTPPVSMPEGSFFELLHHKWGRLARHVLVDRRADFPANERELCEPLCELFSPETHAKVLRCLPTGPLTFCHNDTYHGNVMRLTDGSTRLLDFEFSCLNHRAFDLSNFFAETVTRHGLVEPPHFDIAEPDFGRLEVEQIARLYLAHDTFGSQAEHDEALATLVQDTLDLIPLSDYMYAMAALPLALNPIQTIRFLPYSARRFARFNASFEARFPEG
jgi:thiamine kinase-like enzyme